MAWETTVVQIQHGLTVTHYQLSRLLPKDRFCWRCWFQTGLCLNTHVSQHAVKSHCAWCPSLHTASWSCAVNEQWNNSGRGRKRRPTLWEHFWYSPWWAASALCAHSLLCTSCTVIRCGWVAKKVAAADLGEGEVILLWKTGHLYGEAGKEEWQPVLGDTSRLPRKSGGATLPGLRDDNVASLPAAGRAQKVTKTSWTKQDWRQGPICKEQRTRGSSYSCLVV